MRKAFLASLLSPRSALSLNAFVGGVVLYRQFLRGPGGNLPLGSQGCCRDLRAITAVCSSAARESRWRRSGQIPLTRGVTDFSRSFVCVAQLSLSCDSWRSRCPI
jgi:hypothetical protein